MAAEKKVSEKKVTKKAATKDKKGAKAKSAKVGSQAELTGTILTLTVPQGGQVIREFNLMPSQPVSGQSSDWLLYDPNDPSKQDISNVIINFNASSTSTQVEFERVVFIVHMIQNPAESNGRWRFATNGVAVVNVNPDPNHDVAVEITDAGYTLTAYVHAYSTTQEDINFGYVATFTNNTSGLVTTYESSDPGIIIRR